jgi:DNA topoisomerase I
MKTLVIVESPAKGRKIQDILGKDYVVMASIGHITELGKGGHLGIGVDVNNNFKPRYVLSDDKIEVMDELMKAAKKVDRIIVASDPDREGEAIAWHLSERLSDIGKPIQRMVFKKITKPVIQKSLKELRDIDMDLFHSQEARRILDRIVGFMASPFLMNFFGPKLSAGRVQSVVTRMVIDREREIESFVPEDFWTIQTKLTSVSNESFVAKYVNRITTQADADVAKTALDVKDYVISEVIAAEEKKNPAAPLVTSTLQRLMSKTHGFDAERTMKAAQTLYESGYVSYIRTDSVRVSDEETEALRNWLKANKYAVPAKPHSFKNKDAAQDAHECIHPTDLDLVPGQNHEIITLDEKLVYEMIWKSFIASQMTPAIYDTLSVTAHPQNNPKFKVKASGKALKDKGYLQMFGVDDGEGINIPQLKVGDAVTLTGKGSLKVEKKSTQPPPRYSEDKLIKELDQRNIGRPATYADLLSKICARNYVEKKGNVFHATDLGKKITDELTQYFTFMDYDYTAKMEHQLDEIESGKVNHIDMLKKFFPEFKGELDKAYLGHGGTLCPKCGSPMSLRNSKNGKFLGCSAFPKCRHTVQVKAETAA